MKSKIFTFWEGSLPGYLKLCMDSWKLPVTILTFSNVSQYTNPLPTKLRQFALAKVADYVRVHVLRDSGGIWLDADTIMLGNDLPDATICGNSLTRANTIGFLRADAHDEMFTMWAAFQEFVLQRTPIMKGKDTTKWDIFGNSFTDKFLKLHREIVISDISPRWPETYMISDAVSRKRKYTDFYFSKTYRLADITQKPDIIMLHNSWTPGWVKKLDADDVLKLPCTLTNILREVIK